MERGSGNSISHEDVVNLGQAAVVKEEEKEDEDEGEKRKEKEEDEDGRCGVELKR